MSDKRSPKTDPNQPMIYQIRIKGHMGRQWDDWFENAQITEEAGDTLITCAVIDQAALHGVLKKVRDLGLTLLSINRMVSNLKSKNSSKKEK